uniref:Uncharacterized protein n=1 Tax=Anguilla anguilla TaxID=7936 RepID=A0A0E9PPJ3_ANGAN
MRKRPSLLLQGDHLQSQPSGLINQRKGASDF